MVRKVFKTGNSLVVSIPKDLLANIGLKEGSAVNLELDRENQQILLSPGEVSHEIPGVDVEFAAQVQSFIDLYRPALEELSRS